MSKTKRRLKAEQRRAQQRLHGASRHFTCSNCMEKLRIGEGHYVPPSLGERGFFICTRPDS